MIVVVIGGSGGIGSALVDQLVARENVRQVVATYRRERPPQLNSKLNWHRLDVTDESAMAEWCANFDEIDCLINAAGMLHTAGRGPEKSIRQVDADFTQRCFAVNATATLLLARHAAAALRHGRPAIFAAVSARVGSIEDNELGGWYSYRASKAALNMILKTLAIEWRRSLPRVAVAALHPGTTDSALSRPFQANVPADKLFTPARSAACMLTILDRLTPRDSGKFWSWDGSEIPW